MLSQSDISSSFSGPSSLHLPVQLPGPSLGLPSQLAGSSLALASQLRNQILSCLPLWQLQLWDQSEQIANCRPDLPASAQRYSRLFSHDHVAQQLQLRYSLSTDQLHNWYRWTFKSMRQLEKHLLFRVEAYDSLFDIPLLTPMQAYSRIAFYFGQIGFDLLQVPFGIPEVAKPVIRKVPIFVAQLQADQGHVELTLFRQYLKQSANCDIISVYQALQQSPEVLQALHDNYIFGVSELVNQLIDVYRPNLTQMALIESNDDDPYYQVIQGQNSFSVGLASWQGLMFLASGVPQLTPDSTIGQQFIQQLMLRPTPEQLEQIRNNKNTLYNSMLANFDYFSLRQLQFLGLEADVASILRSLPAPLTLTNGNIIAKWQIACVPLMREWVLDHIPDSSWRRAYLMILEILSGQVITWPVQAADFPVSGDGTFPKNERYVDEFLSRAAGLIMAMSGRIVILPGNALYYYSDVVYNDRQFLKAPNEALSLFNCWRLGRQIALFGKPEPEGTTKPRPLSLYRPISEINSGDIAQMVSAGRRLARSTLLKLTVTLTQMQYCITVLSYNLVIELAQVNDNKLTVAKLVDWLRFYRTTALKYLMHLYRDRPYGNVLNVGYRPEQQTLKAEIVKILSSYIRLSNNSAENKLLLESLADQLLFRIKPRWR